MLTHGGMVPYSRIDADADVFNFKGGRKPMWACGLAKMSPVAMREGWELYTSFVSVMLGGRLGRGRRKGAEEGV